VLIVTHDVDEAITLADRVLVLEGGRIAAEEHISLPRPREVDAAFQALRRRLLGRLGVDGKDPGVAPPTTAAAPLVPFPVRETAL
jgi:sulfonate transport system ATP-binding protein